MTLRGGVTYSGLLGLQVGKLGFYPTTHTRLTVTTPVCLRPLEPGR